MTKEQWKSGSSRDRGVAAGLTGGLRMLRKCSKRLAPLLLIAMTLSVGLPLLMLGEGAVEAATLLPATTSEVAAAADGIVVGMVTGSRSFWQGDYIVTQSTIEVIDWVKPVGKGRQATTITMLQRGGTVADMTTHVPGMPQYEVGEEVLIFLEAKSTGNYVTYGLWQGKRSIVIREGRRYVEMTRTDFRDPVMGTASQDVAVGPPTVAGGSPTVAGGSPTVAGGSPTVGEIAGRSHDHVMAHEESAGAPAAATGAGTSKAPERAVDPYVSLEIYCAKLRRLL